MIGCDYEPTPVNSFLFSFQTSVVIAPIERTDSMRSEVVCEICLFVTVPMRLVLMALATATSNIIDFHRHVKTTISSFYGCLELAAIFMVRLARLCILCPPVALTFVFAVGITAYFNTGRQ